MITDQLQRILASSHFSETTRMKRFLSHLVTETLAGRGAELKGYSLGLDVFDKPSDFDPGLDTIVRVQANKLRARLDLYYSEVGRSDPVRIRVPRGSYAPVFEVAFDPDEPAPRNQARPASRKTLAVMPFDNLSGDPQQEYLADGLTEDLIMAVARFREISVMSKHVTFRYKAQARDPRTVGLQLGVDYLVEGSVRLWDDKLRAAAHLIDAGTGEQLFSDTYDRNLSVQNLFEVQEDIAARIATEIADPHGVIHRTGPSFRRADTRMFDAYQCRLLATRYWRNPTEDEHARVRDLLETAVKIDPDYAGAWGMLAIIYGDEVRGDFNRRDSPAPLERALAAAERSVSLDPLNATGQHALFLTQFHLGLFDGYKDAALKALKANPNYSDMLADMAVCEALVGETDRGFELIERAFQLCPDPPGWYYAGRCLLHYQLANYEAALNAARLVRDSMWNGSEVLVLMCLGQLNREEHAQNIAQSLQRFRGQVTSPAVFVQKLLDLWHVPADMRARIEAALRAVGAI